MNSVTVIIPTYNSAILLPRCLNSVFSQTFKPTEVIVIDDGSTDNTQQLLCSFSNNQIRVIVQDNQGPAAARNRGLKAATGKYVAFLDADDYLEPQFIETTVSFLEQHPEAIAVSVGQIHKIANKPEKIVPRFLEDESYEKSPQVLDSFFAFWSEHNHVCTGSVLMRTEIVKKTGGQREDLRICEDLEFWAYLATFGKWGFIPEVLFVSDGGSVTQKIGWLKKNKIRWSSAPAVEDWQKRIISQLQPKELNSFKKARAKIASNLAYSMILSSRDQLARKTLSYVENHKVNRLTNVLQFVSSHGEFPWRCLCFILRWREGLRNFILK